MVTEVYIGMSCRGKDVWGNRLQGCVEECLGICCGVYIGVCRGRGSVYPSHTCALRPMVCITYVFPPVTHMCIQQGLGGKSTLVPYLPCRALPVLCCDLLCPAVCCHAMLLPCLHGSHPGGHGDGLAIPI